MVLSDFESAKRLQLMVSDIEHDAAEKAEEIEVATEEEFKIARKKVIQRQKEIVDKYFRNCLDKLIMEDKRTLAKIKNELYCKEQLERDRKLREIIELAKQRLDNINHSAHSPSYIKILYLLVVQGLLKLLEPVVVVQARESDVSLVEQILEQAEKFYHEQTGSRTKLLLNKNEFLNSETHGGIILHTKNKQISINNTLAARVDIVSEFILPDIRVIVCDKNPHRRELK